MSAAEREREEALLREAYDAVRRQLRASYSVIAPGISPAAELERSQIEVLDAETDERRARRALFTRRHALEQARAWRDYWADVVAGRVPSAGRAGGAS